MKQVRFPRQKISYRSKTKAWRMSHIEWAKGYLAYNGDSLRKGMEDKRVNYNLVAGILDMNDVEQIMNPHGLEASYINRTMQHYPLINSKLQILLGEEWARDFDFSVSITNPNAITEMGENKKEQLFQKVQQWVTESSEDEQQAMQELEEIAKEFDNTWQDINEINSNYLIKHYYRELGMRTMFNDGFLDPLIGGDEIYRCDIVGGEPMVERVSPFNIRIFLAPGSSKVEDADLIIYWRYRSPNQIIDDYYDVLTDKDIKYLDNLSHYGASSRGDEGVSFLEVADQPYGQGALMSEDLFLTMPVAPVASLTDVVDINGNLRELKIYWKSFRKIKRVKKYDISTGEYNYHFFSEDYIADEALGEEEEVLYINEAWEATNIGEIYLNMRPRLVQYNRLSNPSKCHFGFIGEIYTANHTSPYTMVDMMKPYNYLYNIIHERLLDNIRSNWGKLLEFDFSTVPAGWTVDKWLFFAKTAKLAVKDSFREGNRGAAKGKLVGNMNTATKGVIDAETSRDIQMDIQLLQYIKENIGDFVGITRQREGQVFNRETVGGIERSTLQSNYITNWLFAKHDSVKRRVIECFIDTGKIAWRGKALKFKYLLPDKTHKLITMDGDSFSMYDYGITSDDTGYTDKAKGMVEGLAQAMIQNGMVKASTLIKLHATNSLSEMITLFERDERDKEMREQEAMQQQQQAAMEADQRRLEIEEKKLQIVQEKNIRDNMTDIEVAQIRSEADKENQYQKTIAQSYMAMNKNNAAALEERKRQFEKKFGLDRQKFEFDKKIKQATVDRLNDDLEIREKIADNKIKKDNRR